MEQPTGAI